MRPVRRRNSPQSSNFEPYSDAKPELISRLGSYCSYCERRIATNLAVEHMQPKGLPAYEHLKGCWENFLLACVNCNSTKLNKDVLLDRVLLPDRDNTFAAFNYSIDGTITVSRLTVNSGNEQLAKATLNLIGLDKPISQALDENGKMVAMDRVAQRMQAWANAEESRDDLSHHPDNPALRRSIVRNAISQGFFSIWMTVFQNDIDMRKRFIDAFPGTRNSGCFDSADTSPVSPAPNPDDLASGGKI